MGSMAAVVERRTCGFRVRGDLRFSFAQSKKPCSKEQGFLGCNSLTITYFHTGTRTIIGVESFHGPVRDGKGWYQLAMVIRHDLLPRRISPAQPIGKKNSGLCCIANGSLYCFEHATTAARGSACRLARRTNTRVIGSSLTGN
jgi:hypothetical protein